MVTDNDIHRNTHLMEPLKEHLTRRVLYLKVNVLTMVVKVAAMNNMLDIMLLEIWKQRLVKEPLMVLYKRVR